MSASRAGSVDSWTADEVIRWPLFDPVTLIASGAGIAVEREGLGARLMGRTSTPTQPWSRCALQQEAGAQDAVELRLGDEVVGLRGPGAELAAEVLWSAGAGRPDARQPTIFQGSSGVPGLPTPTTVVGPAGVSALRPRLLLGRSIRRVPADGIEAAWVERAGGVTVAVRQGGPLTLPDEPGLLAAIATSMRGTATEWSPGELPEPPDDVQAEWPVVWVSGQRVRRAWLRAGPSGIDVYAADGSSLCSPASGVRRTDGDSGDAEDEVWLRAGDHEHRLLGPPGSGLRAAFWTLLADEMFRAATSLDAAWSPCRGVFSSARLDVAQGVGHERRDVRISQAAGGLCLVLAEPLPLESGDTARVTLVRGRRRLGFRAQVAGRADVGELPSGMARALDEAGPDAEALVLRPLQAAPDALPARRGLFRLDVLAREVAVVLSLEDVAPACGVLRNVSAGGCEIDVAPRDLPSVGSAGALSGLGPLFGDDVDPCRVHVVHVRESDEQRVVVGLRFDGFGAAITDALQGRVLALERERL